jgi:hypothetical protein
MTPMFFPRFGSWKESELPCCYWTVLRREYNGVIALATALLAFEFAGDVVFERDPIGLRANEEAIVLFALSTAIFFALTLRILKKRTSVLRVAGR